jgi:hypothetical protein
MTPGETGGNTIFYFIQPRRGATKKILSQRNQVAKNLIPKPKNPPRRTSQRVFSARICVKKSRAPRHTGEITIQQRYFTYFVSLPKCSGTGACGALKTNLRHITPGFTGGHRCIDPVMLRDRFLRIWHLLDLPKLFLVLWVKYNWAK